MVSLDAVAAACAGVGSGAVKGDVPQRAALLGCVQAASLTVAVLCRQPQYNRYHWLRLIGPGRVAMQSVFERMHGETHQLRGYSNATEYSW